MLQYIFIYEFMHANDEQKVGIFLANIIASATAFFVVASRVGFICINLENYKKVYSGQLEYTVLVSKPFLKPGHVLVR